MFGMFVIGFPDVVEPLVLALVVAAIMCLTLCQMVLTSACCRDVASKQDMSLIVALSLCYAFLRLLSPSFTLTSLPSPSLLPPSFSNSFPSLPSPLLPSHSPSSLPFLLLPPLLPPPSPSSSSLPFFLLPSPSSPSSHLSSLLPSSLSPTVI